MRKKTVFLLTILISVFLLNNFALAADKPAGKPLEIVYPKIPGVDVIPKTVKTGLPDYVKYVFTFAIVFFGLLILGVLIYNGINYLTSFGNPAKMTDAIQGITAALLGGLLLFGSYLLFNTINPELVILEAPPLPGIASYIVPGVYLCNYKVGNIGKVLSDYMTPLPEITASDYEDKLKIRTEAIKKFREIVGKPDKPDKICFLANTSAPFKNFAIKKNKDQTIFIVPEEKYDPATRKTKWVFNFGLVLHENNNFTGKCKLLPSPDANKHTIYGQIDNFQAGINFDAKAVNLFKRPSSDPAEELQDVALYQGPGFNTIGWKEGEEEKKDKEKGLKANGEKCMEDHECASNYCALNNPSWPKLGGFCRTKPGGFFRLPLFAGLLTEVWAGKDPDLTERHFKVGGAGLDIKIVDEAELKKKPAAPETGKETGKKELYHNTRSMEIKPRDQLFVVLWGDEKAETTGDANEKCEVRNLDDATFGNDPIGKCGTCGVVDYITLPFRFHRWGKVCHPCLEYLIIVKGQIF